MIFGEKLIIFSIKSIKINEQNFSSQIVNKDIRKHTMKGKWRENQNLK